MWLSLPLKLADKVVFSQDSRPLRRRAEGAISGAAPLGKELAAFYDAIGMPLCEGYGLTEGGVAFQPHRAPKPGSIGKPLPGYEVRIAEDGELLLRSPCLFSYYYDDPAGDGGSAARRLAAHRRHRRGRTGISVHHRPQEGADRLVDGQEDPSLARRESVQAGAAGQPDSAGRRPAAVSDRAVHREYAGRRDAEGNGRAKGKPAPKWSRRRAGAQEMRKAVKRVNKQLAPFEQIRKYRILERELTIENGELTATMKVRRAGCSRTSRTISRSCTRAGKRTSDGA